ncbi:hypothetical protein F4819DRAFT_507656 [Hypoxylon fuscum]|nr:hypothetical protein F4819DRAFT_507656 [Hypoxylon fuscum]
MHFPCTVASLTLLAVLPVSAILRDPKCTDHEALDGQYVDGAVIMNDDPLAHFDYPMVTVFNSSVSETWAFDAASKDGKAGIVVYLSRGTVIGSLAAQRGLISVVWPNGTRYMENTFVEESNLRMCKKTTEGTWTNSSGVVTWKFTADKDFKGAEVTIDSPEIQGTFTLRSRGPPLYPGGLVYPDASAHTLLAPQMYWQEQFPVADAEANLTIRGTPFTLSGIGGRDKNWNSFPWAAVSPSWDMVRAISGPYGLMLWNFTSSADGLPYFSATLMKNGKVIFRTASATASDTETYGTVERISTGAVHLASPPGTLSPLPESRHTGYLVNFVSPKTREHWTFTVGFTSTTFWFPASETQTVGQYVGQVTGGLNGKKQYHGYASGSVMELGL